jgi:hypothetical protein
MSAYDAERQFEDNLKNFTESPEKVNLYRGLANIASELQNLSAAMHRLEEAIRGLQTK